MIRSKDYERGYKTWLNNIKIIFFPSLFSVFNGNILFGRITRIREIDIEREREREIRWKSCSEADRKSSLVYPPLPSSSPLIFVSRNICLHSVKSEIPIPDSIFSHRIKWWAYSSSFPLFLMLPHDVNFDQPVNIPNTWRLSTREGEEYPRITVVSSSKFLRVKRERSDNKSKEGRTAWEDLVNECIQRERERCGMVMCRKEWRENWIEWIFFPFFYFESDSHPFIHSRSCLSFPLSVLPVVSFFLPLILFSLPIILSLFLHLFIE